MSYEITFGGRFQAGLNITTGKVVVKAGNLYLPATTANVALYPIAGLVVRYQQVPSANYDVGDIAHAGVWPSSITGLTAATAGVTTYARLTSTGSLENTIAPAAGDWILGRINTDGDLILDGAYEYAVTMNTGPYIIKTLEDYGAVGDGVTDDTAAIQLAFDSRRADSVDRLVAGVGPYLVSDTIEISSQAGHKCVFEGQVDGTAIAPGHATFLWNGAKSTGAAASLTSAGAADLSAADPNQSNLKWNFMTVTGLTGVTPGWVGDLLRTTGAALRAHNGQHMIVKYVSTTSVVIAVMGSLATTDANNGAITWLRLRPVFRVSWRGSIFRNLQCYPNASNTHAHALLWIMHPEHEDSSTDGYPVTRNIYENLLAYDANNSSIEWLAVLGALTLPDNPLHTYYSLETASNYLRPWDGYQTDFQWFRDCLLQGVGGAYSYKGGFLSCPNTAGQVRGIYVRQCATNAREHFFSARGNFGADGVGGFDGRGGSMGGLFENCDGNQISVSHFYLEAPQSAPIEIRFHQSEGYAKLLDVVNGTAAMQRVRIVGGYLQPGSNGVSPYTANSDGVITIRGAVSLTVQDCSLWYQEVVFTSGQFMKVTSSSEVFAVFDNCILPTGRQFGLSEDNWHRIFSSGGQNLYVDLRDCQKYTSPDANFLAIPDQKLVIGGYSATPVGDAKSRILVGGLSNSLFNASNFATTLKFDGTETTKVWAFTNPEQDENFAGHYYEVQCVPIATTGTPAATFAKCARKSRIGAVISMPTAPGGGNSVTFLCTLVRQNAAVSTAYHPLEIAGLSHWFDADRDWRYTIPANKQLNDPGPGAPGLPGYWRNQATYRGLDGNQSVYDLQPFNQDEIYVPDTREVDAGYNNKYVIRCDTTHHMKLFATASFPITGTPATIAIAGHPGTGGSLKIPFCTFGADTGSDYMYVAAISNTHIRVRADVTMFDYAYDWSGKEVVVAVFDGASSRLYVSAKTAVATGTVGSLASPDSNGIVGAFKNPFTLGDSWAGTGGTNALKHAMLIDGALTNAEVGNLLDWLGADVGKAIGA